MSTTALPRVLMLTHRLPYPPDRGDRIRSYHLLKMLSEHADVSLASLTQEDVSDEQLTVLSSLTTDLAIEPVRGLPSKFRALGAVLRRRAITPAMFYEKRLADTITQWHAAQPFDAVLTFCSGMVRYSRLVPGARQLIDLVDVDSVKWDSYAMNTLPPRRWVYQHEATYLRKIEAGVYDKFDALTVVSEREYKTYQHYVGSNPKLRVVGNGVDMDFFSPLPDATGSKKILFVGVLNYRPNIDAVRWFAQNVMPLVREKMADATFEIVGRHPTAEVMDLAKLPGAGVNVIGPVDDVRTHMADAGIVVAPLRIARGVQNKVLEAMACKRVVICSPQAAEGVQAMDGSHYLVGHGPDQWARHIEWMLNDEHSPTGSVRT